MIEKLLRALAEGKRRFVGLPLEKQWFGSLVGFIVAFIFFASVLRFDSQKIISFGGFLYLLLLCAAYVGVILLVAMAYKEWQGKYLDNQKLFTRMLFFLINLAAWGVILAAAFYDAIVLIFVKG